MPNAKPPALNSTWRRTDGRSAGATYTLTETTWNGYVVLRHNSTGRTHWISLNGLRRKYERVPKTFTTKEQTNHE